MGVRSLAVPLLLAYAAGVLATRWLALRAFALDWPIVTAMVTVPLVQTAVLVGWRRWSRRRRR